MTLDALSGVDAILRTAPDPSRAVPAVQVTAESVSAVPGSSAVGCGHVRPRLQGLCLQTEHMMLPLVA
jgi:hypothetical protein